MLFSGDPFGFLHQQHTEALMLKFGRILYADRNNRAVHMQFTHNRTATQIRLLLVEIVRLRLILNHKLWPKRVLRTLA